MFERRVPGRGVRQFKGEEGRREAEYKERNV